MPSFFKDNSNSGNTERLAELENQINELQKANEELLKQVVELNKKVVLLDSKTDKSLAEKVDKDLNNFSFQIQQTRQELNDKVREAHAKIDVTGTNMESRTLQLESEVSSVSRKIVEMESGVKTLTSVVEAQGETLQNQIAFYSNFFSENFTSIFGERFIAETKESFLSQVREDAKDIILSSSADYLRNALTEYLRESIRHEVVVGLSGNKEISKDALEVIVDTVTQNVVAEIIKEIQEPTTTKQGGKNGQNGFAQGANLTAPKQAPFNAKTEHTHQEFERLLGLLEVGLQPMLVGPAGTGKSTAAEQAARALGLPFYSANRVSNAYELTGFINAGGQYMPTQFYEAYAHGGVFLLDEMDASDPEALVTFNNALASDYMCFPCGMVKKHKDFKVIAAGNTYGTGPDAEYSGRNQIDAATRNRFVVLEWDYDKELEKKLVKDKDLLQFCWDLRSVCDKNHLKIIIGTRDIGYMQKAVDAKGFDLPLAIKVTLLEGVKIDTIKTIKGGLINTKGYSENNKYIRALDTIVERDYAKQEERTK